MTYLSAIGQFIYPRKKARSPLDSCYPRSFTIHNNIQFYAGFNFIQSKIMTTFYEQDLQNTKYAVLNFRKSNSRLYLT